VPSADQANFQRSDSTILEIRASPESEENSLVPPASSFLFFICYLSERKEERRETRVSRVGARGRSPSFERAPAPVLKKKRPNTADNIVATDIRASRVDRLNRPWDFGTELSGAVGTRWRIPAPHDRPDSG
jgi:hypothetical protein